MSRFANAALVAARPAQPLLQVVAALRACAGQFGGEAASRKEALLRECAAWAVTEPATLLAYHDCLLFLLAYPESPKLLALARGELDRVAAAARQLVENGGARAHARLANSGVAWAPMTIAFGHDIARWLAMRYPGNAEIDSFDPAGAPLADVLAHVLPPMEFELLATEAADSGALLTQASEGQHGTRLSWLLAQFAQLPCPPGLRDHLFDSVRAYITISPGASRLSRTFVRGPVTRIHFQRVELKRAVDPAAILDQPLEPPSHLDRGERLAHRLLLLDAGRAMLASLGRETDAIAASAPECNEYHALGRGAGIALYAMAPGRGAPLDSHVGFMLFRNSLPVAYGGGWPFLGTAKIGVNIFAPYRGGESAYLFCQVLRVYRQRFGVDHFIAEPSQFGGGNREGLASGAFWFYYRLGFRPVAPAVAAVAAQEFDRMRSRSGYRSPVAVLRRFTRSDIEWHVNGDSGSAPCDPADLSLAVSAWIAQRFHGNRAAATAHALPAVTRSLRPRDIARWPASELAAFQSFCPLLVLIPGLERWPARDKAAVIALARAKGADEFRYHHLLRRHARLGAALRQISARSR
jgi:hypothetical protein